MVRRRHGARQQHHDQTACTLGIPTLGGGGSILSFWGPFGSLKVLDLGCVLRCNGATNTCSQKGGAGTRAWRNARAAGEGTREGSYSLFDKILAKILGQDKFVTNEADKTWQSLKVDLARQPGGGGLKRFAHSAGPS